ncbi:MAG: hypothetical protein ACFB2X_22525 [Rivularia sp. (in: cyanobacteria)]
MSSQRKLRYCLAIVVALLGLPQPLVFAESPTELNQISTEKSPRLTNIGANDFFVNGRQSSTVTNSQGFYTSLPFKSDTTRTVTWEMRVNKSELRQPLEIEYEVIDDNNRSNQLNKEISGTDPTLPVTVTRLENQESTEEDCSSETEGECETLLVKGAAQLTIDISQFRQAGEYNGNLSVCLKNNDGGCI